MMEIIIIYILHSQYLVDIDMIFTSGLDSDLWTWIKTFHLTMYNDIYFINNMIVNNELVTQ